MPASARSSIRWNRTSAGNAAAIEGCYTNGDLGPVTVTFERGKLPSA